MKDMIKLVVVGAALMLTACAQMTSHQGGEVAVTSTSTSTGAEELVPASTLASADSGQPIGSFAMDQQDKQKMSHALDKPLGKETRWDNGASGVSYTVTPLRKVTVSGNQFCRIFSATATRSGGEAKELNGTACVASDGMWRQVSG